MYIYIYIDIYICIRYNMGNTKCKMQIMNNIKYSQVVCSTRTRESNTLT